MKIMIDMDDVMVENGVIELVRKFLNEDVQLDENNFYIQDLVGDRKKEFFEYFVTQNQYEYCNITEGAYDVIKKLYEKHDVYVCTSYMWREIPKESGIILGQKHKFLMNEFSFIDPYKYIFISDKSVINCDVRIDDKLDNLTGDCKKILYTAYHNKNISDEVLAEKNVIRANSWKEIEDILLK